MRDYRSPVVNLFIIIQHLPQKRLISPRQWPNDYAGRVIHTLIAHSRAKSSFKAPINLSFSSGVPTLMRTYSLSIGALLMSRIRMPRAYRASNKSPGGILVLTQKKFAADGTGDNPS